MEMYLETILRLCKSNEKVRAVDIANQMRISKVSVCHAIKNLQAKDYVTYESRFIRLTKKGRILAEEIYERHCELTKLLISLGVDSATAEQDACRIEHCISQETFEDSVLHQLASADGGAEVYDYGLSRLFQYNGGDPGQVLYQSAFAYIGREEAAFTV